jgi:thiol-disulfide isomerase/thioredoxin
VLIIVVVLVIVKVTGSSNNVSGPAWSPASPATVSQVANVPGSVYDTVGVRSSVASVTPPITVKNQPPLVFPGTSLPGVYYYGAEYCPYCAAERWAIIAALSRFGTFKNLGNMESSSTDVYANTQTFTFSKASYTSKYIAFRADEYYSNQVPPSGVGYTVLQVPSAYESQLVKKYDSATYFGGSPSNYPAFPFLDFGNKVLQLSSNYDPGLLAGYTRDQIAAGLNNPKSPVTQAIVATANYITAATCMADGNKPGSVCTSKGVTEAAKKITAGTAG